MLKFIERAIGAGIIALMVVSFVVAASSLAVLAAGCAG